MDRGQLLAAAAAGAAAGALLALALRPTAASTSAIREDEVLRELSKQRQLRQQERTGRIRAEKKLRQLADGGGVPPPSGGGSGGGGPAPLPTHELRVIGRISTPWRERNGAPRQGVFCPSAVGRLRYIRIPPFFNLLCIP